MQIVIKLFSVEGTPASDGSIIPRHVVEEYLSSDKYKTDIACRKMLGSLTHRCRNWQTQKVYDQSISRVAGKDDSLLSIGVASPTHVIDKVWINDSDGWVHCLCTVLDEDGLDDEAIQNIRRLKGLLKQGIMPGSSAVILGFWDSTGKKCDTLKRMVALKGVDITMNPSWVDSSVVEVIDDNGDSIAKKKYFSDIELEESRFDGELQVKTFSDTSIFGDYPKTSKIEDKFTFLKAKEFSAIGTVTEYLPNTESYGIVEEKKFCNVESKKERTFSATTLRERVKYAKFSPRMRFRRLFLDYKMLVKQMGGVEKIDEETLKILKSLFTTDVLDIFKTITPEIMAGKQINTLIGASSLGKGPRLAAQKLQMPARLAYQEMSKKGTITPMRFKKLQEAYMEFTNALSEEVFGSNPIPEDLKNDLEEGE